jgi:hypothetical protein
MDAKKILRDHLAAIGSKGGKSCSEAKRAAARINVAKALAARLAKLENTSK